MVFGGRVEGVAFSPTEIARPLLSADEHPELFLGSSTSNDRPDSLGVRARYEWNVEAKPVVRNKETAPGESSAKQNGNRPGLDYGVRILSQ